MMLRKLPDLEAVSRAGVDELVRIARAAVDDRGACHVALSGGSTPKRMFQLLSAMGRDALPWDRIDLWWGDERTVAPSDSESNYRMTREHLIDALRLDPVRIHRIDGELRDHAAAARAYEAALIAALGEPPILDLVLLGMGPDGHTASLFPYSAAISDTSHWVVANPVDSPVAKGKTTRITLTAPAINAARSVRFLVTGADKAATLAAVLHGPRDPQKYPAQLITPVSGDLVWLVDTAAASLLGGEP